MCIIVFFSRSQSEKQRVELCCKTAVMLNDTSVEQSNIWFTAFEISLKGVKYVNLPNLFLIDSLRNNSMNVWLPTFGTRLKNNSCEPVRAVLFNSHALGSNMSSSAFCSNSSSSTSDCVARMRSGFLRS